ncbi:MAG: IreB family regulatory phosphoprotein [Clostridia bacterium]|nr:IreB family regulatory phosphoprotein [Clostridia bacterium]
MDGNLNETARFSIPKEKSKANEVLTRVYASMKEKGYDPVNQIVGYLISGDPTYITSYNNARYLIRMLERDELLEELVRFYMEQNDTTPPPYEEADAATR